MKLRRFAMAFAACITVAGCAKHPYAISKDDQNRFADGLISVTVPHHADPMILGISGCTLYRAKIQEQNITGWDVTLASDWGMSNGYLGFMTGCSRETLKWDGKYVRVYFCAQALGAGGGCVNGGDYRSRTGARPWEISDDGPNGKFYNLPQ